MYIFLLSCKEIYRVPKFPRLQCYAVTASYEMYSASSYSHLSSYVMYQRTTCAFELNLNGGRDLSFPVAVTSVSVDFSHGSHNELLLYCPFLAMACW